jgi:carboxymethylenebutenolidase
MIRRASIVLVVLSCSFGQMKGQDFVAPDTISLRSGALTLTALLWRPSGPGPFPALIFCHGNYASKSIPGTVDSLLGSITPTSLLGRVFARNGYMFFALFRKGVGLSRGQGETSLDLLNTALQEKSLDERNALQVHLLETEQLEEMRAGLKVLRSRPDVDTNRLAVIGHSFGGSLALLLAESDPCLNAVVDFGGGAGSWDRSHQLRARLTTAVTHLSVPVFFIHAKNDYSISPAVSLGAVMDRLAKPHAVRIYPPFGNNSDAGHNFIFLGIPIWEHDVLGFLNESLRR